MECIQQTQVQEHDYEEHKSKLQYILVYETNVTHTV